MNGIRKHRGLKRYYKNLATENDLDKATWLDFDNPKTWFDNWHLHFDWKVTVTTVLKDENRI